MLTKGKFGQENRKSIKKESRQTETRKTENLDAKVFEIKPNFLMFKNKRVYKL